MGMYVKFCYSEYKTGCIGSIPGASAKLCPQIRFAVRDTATLCAMVGEGLGVRCMQQVSPATAEFMLHARAYASESGER